MPNDDTRIPPKMERAAAPEPYIPAGEERGVISTFSAEEMARAFNVDESRVHNAIRGEFGLRPEDVVDSRQAQHLAEVLLGDLPLDQRQAALMMLGSYTPRSDEIEATVREEAPGEESDRLRPTEEVPDLGAPKDVGE